LDGLRHQDGPGSDQEGTLMRRIHLIATEQQRKDPAVDALLSALQRHAWATVDLVSESTSHDALLLSWSWNLADVDPATARRTILLNAPLAPSLMFEQLERGGFAGGVPMTLWTPDKPIDMHLAGLRSVVGRLGATPVEGRYASEHYCYYQRSTPAPLERGILEYLEALDRELDQAI
jgi:hypothetical protein